MTVPYAPLIGLTSEPIAPPAPLEPLFLQMQMGTPLLLNDDGPEEVGRLICHFSVR